MGRNHCFEEAGTARSVVEGIQVAVERLIEPWYRIADRGGERC